MAKNACANCGCPEALHEGSVWGGERRCLRCGRDAAGAWKCSLFKSRPDEVDDACPLDGPWCAVCGGSCLRLEEHGFD